MTLIGLRSIDKFYGGRAVLRGLEMDVGPGARIGLVGPNLLMLEEPNCLILDEPTNHLDIASLEVLERELEKFPGTVVFVSHDRYFLDRLADRLVEVRDGELHRHEGGYTAWREREEGRRGPLAAGAWRGRDRDNHALP